MQGRNEIVVPVLRLVVDRSPTLHDLDKHIGIEKLVLARGAPDLLGKRQHRAAVAISHADQAGAGIFSQRQRLAFHGLGPAQ